MDDIESTREMCRERMIELLQVSKSLTRSITILTDTRDTVYKSIWKTQSLCPHVWIFNTYLARLNWITSPSCECVWCGAGGSILKTQPGSLWSEQYPWVPEDWEIHIEGAVYCPDFEMIRDNDRPHRDVQFERLLGEARGVVN